MFVLLNTVQIFTFLPHPTKSTVAITGARKFFIAWKLSPHRISLSSRFNYAWETEHHRAFPKNLTGLSALCYESGATQNIPSRHKRSFCINGHASTSAERGKKQSLKTWIRVVIIFLVSCAVSSVGRALPRHGRGHRFKSCTAHHLLQFLSFFNTAFLRLHPMATKLKNIG